MINATIEIMTNIHFYALAMKPYFIGFSTAIGLWAIGFIITQNK